VSSDGQAIATALRRDPLYVDPAYDSALPKATRAGLVKHIRRSPVPIFVILVPLVKGGTWQTSEQLTTVVQAHLGRDGAYVTFNTDFDDVFDVVRWGGTDAERRDATDAGWAVSYEKRYTTLAARLGRCVELIAAGQGTEAYQKDQNAAFPPDHAKQAKPAKPAPHKDSGDGLILPIGAAAVVAAAAGLWWLRRRRDRAAIEALKLPHTVFGTARKAEDDELRARAERDLIALGEDLPADTRALDAYTAAGRTLDDARSTADLAGVLALIQTARGKTPCYFDPRHGEGVITVAWRAPGTRPKHDVRVCAACATAVRDRRAPDVVLDRGRPYYEAATPWAETGYGQLADLVGRILGTPE
jgi:hypothetical protein